MVKVDSNGSFPKKIKKIIQYIDFFALDFKSLNYTQFSNISLEKFLKSLDIIKKSNVDYEVRITMYPNYIKEKEFDKIRELLIGVKKIALQQYKSENIYIDEMVQAYDVKIIYEFAEILRNNNIKVEVRE